MSKKSIRRSFSNAVDSLKTPEGQYMKDVAKWISLTLVIIGMVVAAVAWAGNEHADIKTWTAEQDYVTKKETTEIMKEHYVPKEDFARVEENLKNQKEDIEEIKYDIKEILTEVKKVRRRGTW